MRARLFAFGINTSLLHKQPAQPQDATYHFFFLRYL